MSSSTPFVRSACCNRSWSGRWVARSLNSSWANAAGELRSRPQWTRSRRSFGRPQTTTYSAMPCWKTCTGLSSTRLKRPRPISRCSRTSAAPRRSWLARIKRSRPQISNTIRLLRLPPTVQRRIAAGVISAGHARALLAIEDPGGQERLAQRVVAEGLSVRAVEELVTLGDHREKTARQRHQSKIVAPKAKDLADRLSDHFETRVKVELGRTKGKIIIEFATIDDLERIVALIGNEQMRPEPVEQLGQAQPTAQQYRQSDIQEEAGAEATVSA